MKGEPRPELECSTSQLWLDLLDGDLSPAERHELEHHLKVCDSCSILLNLAPGRSLNDPATLHGGDAHSFVATLPLADAPADRHRERDSPRAPDPRITIPRIAGLVEFRLVRRGGMGVVFAARETNLDRPVAVKMLASGGRHAPSGRARASRESLLMASLRHPNVVQIYRIGEADGLPYLIMEWIDGGTLKDRIDARLFSPLEAAATVRPLARAVAAAHALDIIHRDLKPENVMIVPTPDDPLGFIPKLTDFGIARQGEADGLTETGVICGTPGYMAPEQTGFAQSAAPVGPATDIHGLGAILFACLTGKAPYTGHSSWDKLVHAARGARLSLRISRPDIPTDLATIVDKCLQLEMHQRYRSAAELADDLDRFLTGRPILARPVAIPERVFKWSRRHPTLAGCLAIMILGSAGAAAGAVYHVMTITRALSDLATEEDKTRHALILANQARDQAQRALVTLSDDVVKRILERGTALNDADREFLDLVRGYYLNWPLGPNPEAALKLRAEGLARLGDIFENIDQYAESRRCREAAIGEYDEAIRRGFDRDEVVDARIKALVLLHQVLQKSSRAVAAEAVTRRLIATHEPLAATSVNHRRNLGLDFIRLGNDLTDQHRESEAAAAFQTGTQRLDQLRLDQPNNQPVRKAQLRAYYIWGDCFRFTTQAESLFRRLLARAEEALVPFPQDPDILRYQYLALAELVTLLTPDRPDEALTSHRRRLILTQNLVGLRPESKLYRSDLVSGLGRTYHVYARLNRAPEAEPALKRALELGTAMYDAEPAVFDRAYVLVEVLEAHGLLCEATGRPNRAVEQWDRITTICQPWLQLGGRTVQVSASMRSAYRHAADLLTRLGDHPGAARRLAIMVDLCPPGERAQAQLDLARALMSAGDLPAARSVAEQANAGPTAPEAARLIQAIQAKSGTP